MKGLLCHCFARSVGSEDAREGWRMVSSCKQGVVLGRPAVAEKVPGCRLLTENDKQLYCTVGSRGLVLTLLYCCCCCFPAACCAALLLLQCACCAAE
jgi:hypothetical protein